MAKKTTYICFCCGWDQLDTAPYENVPKYPVDTTDLTPPYEQHWGGPSYSMCPCCGFEFGTDDEQIGEHPGDSFESARQKWLSEEKAAWADDSLKPEGWSLEKQMSKLITLD